METNRFISEIFIFPGLALVVVIYRWSELRHLAAWLQSGRLIPVTKQSSSFCWPTAVDMPSWIVPWKNMMALLSANAETSVFCRCVAHD